VTPAQVLAGQTLRMMREAHGLSLRTFADLVGYRLATDSLTRRIGAALAELPVRA